MGRGIQHKFSYERNKKIINEKLLLKNGDEYSEWQVVLLFYAAIHAIELYLHFNHGKCPGSHVERRKIMVNTPLCRNIIPEYDLLYTNSRRARYYHEVFTNEDIEDNELLLKTIEDKIGVSNIVSKVRT